MTPDEEREAEAYMVWKQHGHRAPSYVALRINTLTGDRDHAGVDRWMQIAQKLETLMYSLRS